MWAVAIKIAAEHSEVDLWEWLPDKLEHTVKHFKPNKWKFTTLFEHNIREMFRRDAARVPKRLEKENARLAEVGEYRRVHEQTERGAAYSQWMMRLWSMARSRLDATTQRYIELYLKDMKVKDIAAELGLAPNTLSNRYGGRKLRERVRLEVRRLILELPRRHQQLLVRHLRDEVGLSQSYVVELLCIDIAVDRTTPLLEDFALLAILGWDTQPPAWQVAA